MKRSFGLLVLSCVWLGCSSSGDGSGDVPVVDGAIDDTGSTKADSSSPLDSAVSDRDAEKSDTASPSDAPAVDAPAGDTADAGPKKALLGVYVGNDPTDLTAFEKWLGHPVDGVLGYTGAASWTDYDGSVGWASGLWAPLDRRVLWSVPLIPTGATLEDAAAGKYDDHYLKAAKTLATFRPSEPVLYIRTGWEFNGDWFPWAAKGKAAAFAGAYQKFVTAFRSVSKRFVFEWNVNVGDVGMNPETAYPGDAYVDIIGMDFYWNTDWDPKEPEAAWTSMRDRTYGLKWHQDFAKTHGKPTAYSEWGIRSDAAAPYIAHAQDWFDSHPVLYQTYWNSNSAFPGELSKGQYPAAAAKYKAIFGP